MIKYPLYFDKSGVYYKLLSPVEFISVVAEGDDTVMLQIDHCNVPKVAERVLQYGTPITQAQFNAMAQQAISNLSNLLTPHQLKQAS